MRRPGLRFHESSCQSIPDPRDFLNLFPSSPCTALCPLCVPKRETLIPLEPSSADVRPRCHLADLLDSGGLQLVLISVWSNRDFRVEASSSGIGCDRLSEYSSVSLLGDDGRTLPRATTVEKVLAESSTHPEVLRLYFLQSFSLPNRRS